jgi:hypothetical protein
VFEISGNNIFKAKTDFVRRPRVAEALAEAQALLPLQTLWQPKGEGG